MMLAQAQPSPAPLPEIRDIAPVVDVFPWPWWLVALVALTVFCAVALLVVLIVAKLREKAPPPPPPSARARALKQLHELESQIENMDAHAFSVAVSDVIRNFIGTHFGLRATKQTSPEFLAAIAHAPQFTDGDRALLAQFLEKCDFIKFAHVDAGKEEMKEQLSSAIGFVQWSGA
jgi:Domain of unknown function (DUF4381)